MNQFLIAATDIRTNATLYGRLSTSGKELNFRAGLGIEGTADHTADLFMDPRHATRMAGDVACNMLALHTRRIAGLKSSWVRDLRVVLA